MNEIYNYEKYFQFQKDKFIELIKNNEEISNLEKLRLLSENELLPIGEDCSFLPLYCIDFLEEMEFPKGKVVNLYDLALFSQNNLEIEDIYELAINYDLIGAIYA